MSKQNLDVLRNRIDNVIDIHRKTGITNAEVVGVLEIVKSDIIRETIQECSCNEDDNDSSEDWK